MTEIAKRLYKSRSNRMLDGICGGTAEYFGVDPTLVRIAWVLLTLLGGSGIILYIVAMIIMPVNPVAVVQADSTSASPGAAREKNTKFWGILLIGVGFIWFLSNLGVPIWHHWWGFSWDVLLPVLLILAGVAFIFGGRNSITPVSATPAADGAEPSPAPAAMPHRLVKSRTERKMFGVCGGIGTYFDVDPTLVRLLFIIAAFASFGFMFLLYLVMAIVVPQEPLAVKS
jgi:phage shock protein C